MIFNQISVMCDTQVTAGCVIKMHLPLRGVENALIATNLSLHGIISKEEDVFVRLC